MSYAAWPASSSTASSSVVESEPTSSSMPVYSNEDFGFYSSGSPQQQQDDVFFSYPTFRDAQPVASSSSPSAGSSSASSSSTPPTPNKASAEPLPSPLTFDADTTPSATAPLGSGWVSSTPCLSSTASVAERCKETGFFLTLSSEVDKKLRTVQACDACRARKAKCDGLKDSCTRCIQRGVSCSYTTGPRRPAKAPKRPSVCSSRSDSMSSASSSAAALSLASHVKLQSLASNSQARRSSKFARRESTDSVVSASEPLIVEPSAPYDEHEYAGELAYGWSADGLASPFELSYAPVQPQPEHGFYSTPDARSTHPYRRASFQHAPAPYSLPYPRQRSASHQVSSAVGFFDSPTPAQVYTPIRSASQSVLVHRRKAPSAYAPYPTSENDSAAAAAVPDDEFFYAPRPSANVYQTPAGPPRRVHSAPQLAPPALYTPAFPLIHHHHPLQPQQETVYEPFATEPQQVEYESSSAWTESQPLWGDAVY